MEMIGSYKELDRVRWAAKRGMLELDLILSPYVEQVYMTLSDKDNADFLSLLSSEDPDLFSWFIKSQPVDIEHVETVRKVLEYKRLSHA